MRAASTILLMITVLRATFTGRVTPDSTLVQSADTTYSFILNFSKEIPRDGRLVIRFPQDYATQDFNVECDTQTGFTTGTTQTKLCVYQATTRMLTLTGVYPTTSKQLQLKVSGVTNPSVAKETGSFQVSSYSLSAAGDYVLMETGGSSLTITPTAGSLQQPTLTLKNPTVGLLTVLTLQFGPEHSIPADGKIQLQLPKWNQYDPYSSNYESMIAVATSPGEVECLPQLGLVAQTTCFFTSGEVTDLLEIQMAELTAIVPNTLVSMLVQGVRAPPSQNPVTGFTLKTTDSTGSLIDMSTSMLLKATIPVQGSSSSAEVFADPVTINSVSNVTLIMQNNNPLLQGATVRISVPDDFDMSRGPVEVTTSGISLDPNPIVNFEPSTRTLVIQRFNLEYLEQLSYSYFYIYGMGNPGQTHVTSSFKIYFLDQSMQQVEYVESGVTFQATVNGFVSVAMTAASKYINEDNVGYTFTLEPEDSFNSTGVIKLTFPVELYVRQGAYFKPVSSNMKAGAKVTVLYNRVVTIENGFPNGYQAGDQISFTLIGVTNPPTTDLTGGVTVKIYYTEQTSEINVYNGNDLTFKAEPSNQVSITVSLNERETGQVQTNLTLIGATPDGMVIAKGSYLKVSIPKQFLISDAIRVAASCTSISGFSDEILCEFESVSSRQGSVLIVRQGFDSSVFPGGDFAFTLSELKNPFTTEDTDAFGISIYDKNGRQLYIPDANTETTYVRAQDFAFSFVQSNSPVNGASVMYNFSITVSVDTPAGTNLQVQLPNDIVFDESKPFECVGTMGFAAQMQCYYRNGRSLWITMLSDDTFEDYFLNGTTLEFQLGYIKNPVSLKPSQSFNLATYDIDTGGLTTQYFYINQKISDLKISNTERAKIFINNISQFGEQSSELGQNCKLLFNLTTEIPIPAGSKLSIIVPTNLQVSGELQMRINGQEAAGVSIDVATYTVYATVTQGDQTNFTVAIISGLKNPLQAPYQYNSFNIEFNTDDGWGIAHVISLQTWIDVPCTTGCQLCRNSLATCVECGADTSTALSYYLEGDTCMEQCPAGKFGGPGYECLPCISPCLECKFANDLCTVCDPASELPYTNLVSLSCYSECPSGTFADPDTMQCLPCELPCYTCTSATQCLTCDSTVVQVFYFNQTCLDQCPDVSLASPSNVCVDCEAPCLQCSGLPDKCLSCTEGLYLFKNLCVADCPWQYFNDDENMKCLGVASIYIPMPFSILMIGISIGVAISSCMKHSGNGSTAFWITCLALCDILLRANWLVMGILALQNDFEYTFYGCMGLLLINMVINLMLWRRFFKYKYNMDENDKAFVTYCKNYPRTSEWLIFLSYLITFQAIRLTYSKALGKKMFMASFTRQKRYYRLIGQLSLIQIFFMYLPAIGLMVYSIGWEFGQNDQLFYLGIDSLFLVTYGTILITVVLTQRERVMQPRELFQWSELCRCCVDSDEEKMYDREEEDEDSAGIQLGSRRRPRQKVMGVFGSSDSDLLPKKSSKVEAVDLNECDVVMSAACFEDVQKVKLYQTEQRDRTKKGDAFSIIDYNGFRMLQDKLDRIKLKANLYENRRDNDYNKVQELSSEIHSTLGDKEDLKKLILKLQLDLAAIQSSIDEEVKHLDHDVGVVIRKKRNEIAKRSVQSNQPHAFTLNSIEHQNESPENNLFNYAETGVQQTISSSGYHNSGASRIDRNKGDTQMSDQSSKLKQSFGRPN